MSSSKKGRRLRRAALLTLFFSAVIGSASTALTQPTADYGSTPNGFVVSDGGCYDNGLSCNESYCSEPGACDGGCNQYFDDGYKHYCPVWVGGEWIHWRLDGNRLPPLVTDG